MLVVKVWCLPRQTEEELEALYKALVASIMGCKFGFKDERDMVILFPADMMAYGLGSEIIVEFSHLPLGMRNITAYNTLTRVVGEGVSQRFPSARVQCFVSVPDQYSRYL